MIMSVCLNPCVDKTVTIDKLTPYGMNRIKSIRFDYVGKGVNVAENMRALLHDVVCVGIIGDGFGCDEIISKLERNGITHEFIRLPGDVRTNMKVIDESVNRVTEFNESGVAAPPEAEAMLLDIVRRHALECVWVVLTGSAPRGIGRDIYAKIIAVIREVNPHCKIALDAEGDLFTNAIAMKPNLVKPNDYELSIYCGKPCETIDEIRAAGRRLIDEGIEEVLVSMGANGAILMNAKEALFMPAADVEVRNATGAGDAMLSGYLHGRTRGMYYKSAFMYATAAAGAKVASEGTVPINKELIDVIKVQLHEPVEL